MVVPDSARARQILEAKALPRGVVVHAEGVSRVAAEAARLVQRAGVPIDVRLVEIAALLHDIDKMETRDGPGEHGLVGAAELDRLGYPELAPPVASHPVTCLLDESRFPRGWPSVIVSIADRHVAQRFMTIDERIDDQLRRHPQYAASLGAARRPAHALEAELAEVTAIKVPDLVERLREAWRAGGGR
jgi:putative nucleotidyltransferase with HDIG domain